MRGIFCSRVGLFSHAIFIAMVSMLVIPESPAQEKPGKKDKTKKSERGKRDRKKKGKKEEAAKQSIASLIGDFTGVGRGHRDLVVPQRDNTTRKLTARIKARSVDRIDENTLRFQRLSIQEYTPEGAEDLYIDVNSGNFDMESGMLIGDSVSVLGVPGQFKIVGGGLVCDTSEKDVDGKKVRAQVARMEGPVKMTIFDTSKKKSDGTERERPDKKPKPAKKGGIQK